MEAGLPGDGWPLRIAAAGSLARVTAIGECMVEMAPRDGGGYALGFAGDTFNTAWYLQRLAGERLEIGYLSAVGQDDISDRMLAFMRAAGIRTADVARIEGRSVGLYLVSLRDGERTFSYWRDSSAARLLAHDLGPLQGRGAGDLVYLSGISLAILPPEDRPRLRAAVAEARAAGALVAFDPNIRPRLWESAESLRDETSAMAAGSDILLPSFDDEATIFGDADPEATCARYAALGAGLCVVKNGAGEIVAAAPDGAALRHPVTPVDRVVDTTAAGDSFNAGFLAGLAAGLSVRDSIAAGCRVSAKVVQGRGALVELPPGLVAAVG
ncbi:sugar kinase [Rhodobacterales bacterium HKCCE3408]|nr:sugar kinase [Rhodobacterales bacterium HKCCE3408]